MGADYLDGGTGADEFSFYQGDSPLVSFLDNGLGGLNSGDVYNLPFGVDLVSGSGFASAWDKINFEGEDPDQVAVTSMGSAPSNGLVTDQKYFTVQGNYLNGSFTVNTTAGKDTLVVYDGDPTSGVTQTAIVITSVIPSQLTQLGGPGSISLSGGADFTRDTTNSVSYTVTGLPSGSQARSYSLWVNTTDKVGGAVLVSQGTISSYQKSDLIFNSDGSIVSDFQVGYVSSGPTNLNDGAAHFLVTTFDATAGVSIYLDGVKLATTVGINGFNPASVNTINNNNKISFAGQIGDIGGFGAPSHFTGTITQGDIWNTALTQQQVSTLYSGGSLASLSPLYQSSGTVNVGGSLAGQGGSSLWLTTSVADTFAPTLPTTYIDGNTVNLIYNEDLDATHLPSMTAFEVDVGGVARAVNWMTVSGDRVTLNISSPVKSGDLVSVNYTDATTANDVNAIQDQAGNDAGSFAGLAVRNITAPANVVETVGRELVLNGSFELGKENWPTSGTPWATNGVPISADDGMWTFNPEYWVCFVESEATGTDNIPGWTTGLDQNGNRGNFDLLVKPEAGEPAFLDGRVVCELDGFLTTGDPEPNGSALNGGSHAYVKQVLSSQSVGNCLLTFDFMDHVGGFGTSDFAVFLNDTLSVVFTKSASANVWRVRYLKDGQLEVIVSDLDSSDGVAGWQSASVKISSTFGSIKSLGFQGGSWNGSVFDPIQEQDSKGAFIDAVSLKDFSTSLPVPPAPLLALGIGVSDGATAAEATAASGALTVSAIAASSVSVTLTNGSHTVAKALTGTGVATAVTLTAGDLTTLGDGVIRVSATATDAAGNASTASATSFILDTVAPIAPFITSIGGSDSVVSSQSGDNLVVGTGEPGSIISIKYLATGTGVIAVPGPPGVIVPVGGTAVTYNAVSTVTGTATTAAATAVSATIGTLIPTVLGTATADASTGAFSYALSVDNLAYIGQGAGKMVVALATDAAGNVGPLTLSSQFKVDTGATSQSNLHGIDYFWKPDATGNHALLSGVTVNATGGTQPPEGANAPVQLKNITWDTTGHATVDVYAHVTTGVDSVQINLGLGSATNATFTSALTSDWTLLGNPSGGEYVIGGYSITALSTGDIKLGTLAFDTGAAAQMHLAVDAGSSLGSSTLSGSQGTITATPYGYTLAHSTTGADGAYTMSAIDRGSYALTAARSTSDISNAITSADALAALKIAVGIDPNPGTGTTQLAVSPFQIMAADVNSDGRVTSADALAVLKMAVHMSTALTPQWMFVDETRDLSGLSRTNASWDHNISATVTGTTTDNLVGVLSGDVNGSWLPPTGTQYVETTDPTHFTNLNNTLHIPMSEWGVL